MSAATACRAGRFPWMSASTAICIGRLTLAEIVILNKFERLTQAHSAKIVDEHRIGIRRQTCFGVVRSVQKPASILRSERLDLVSKLMIGDDSQPVPQCLRERG